MMPRGGMEQSQRLTARIMKRGRDGCACGTQWRGYVFRAVHSRGFTVPEIAWGGRNRHTSSFACSREPDPSRSRKDPAARLRWRTRTSHVNGRVGAKPGHEQGAWDVSSSPPLAVASSPMGRSPELAPLYGGHDRVPTVLCVHPPRTSPGQPHPLSAVHFLATRLWVLTTVSSSAWLTLPQPCAIMPWSMITPRASGRR